MNSDNVPREPFQLSWRLELVAFFSLFFGIVAIDALIELHKTGHPIASLVFRALILAAFILTVLRVWDGVRTR